MPRTRKIIRAKRFHIPRVPDNAAWLESDSYDRRAWNELGLGAPAIRTLIDAGEVLVPYFGTLLEDLFFGLFKYNLVWLPAEAVRRSALLNRTILQQLIPTPGFEILKSRTLLEEDKAVIAALVLGEQVLEMVRAERLVNRREMLDLWDLKHQEEELEQSAAALKNAQELSDQHKQGSAQESADKELQN